MSRNMCKLRLHMQWNGLLEDMPSFTSIYLSCTLGRNSLHAYFELCTLDEANLHAQPGGLSYAELSLVARELHVPNV